MDVSSLRARSTLASPFSTITITTRAKLHNCDERISLFYGSNLLKLAGIRTHITDAKREPADSNNRVGS